MILESSTSGGEDDTARSLQLQQTVRRRCIGDPIGLASTSSEACYDQGCTIHSRQGNTVHSAESIGERKLLMAFRLMIFFDGSEDPNALPASCHQARGTSLLKIKKRAYARGPGFDALKGPVLHSSHLRQVAPAPSSDRPSHG